VNILDGMKRVWVKFVLNGQFRPQNEKTEIKKEECNDKSKIIFEDLAGCLGYILTQWKKIRQLYPSLIYSEKPLLFLYISLIQFVSKYILSLSPWHERCKK
jgi:hypothetical protein